MVAMGRSRKSTQGRIVLKNSYLACLDRICENNILVTSVFCALTGRFSVNVEQFPTF
jgi:hypothetical protein